MRQQRDPVLVLWGGWTAEMCCPELLRKVVEQ